MRRSLTLQFTSQAHNVTDHLGHGHVMLFGNLLVNLHGGIERPRQRRIFNHGNIVRLGHFADFQGQRIDTLATNMGAGITSILYLSATA